GRLIPNSITRSLVKTDNMKDIDTYVQTTVDGSERLKIHFRNEKVDPLAYFHEKANGIFLWVAVVLHQLAQTKSSSLFKKYLDGFSDSSGDMEHLYSSILLKIDGEDRKWIQQILRWLVVAQRELSVKELQAAVE